MTFKGCQLNGVFRIFNDGPGIQDFINSPNSAQRFLQLGIDSDKGSYRTRHDQRVEKKSRQLSGRCCSLHDLLASIPDQHCRNEKGEPQDKRTKESGDTYFAYRFFKRVFDFIFKAFFFVGFTGIGFDYLDGRSDLFQNNLSLRYFILYIF